MNRLTSQGVLVALFFMLGCAAHKPVVLMAWKGNGNPGMPICSASADPQCVSAYTITNQTTGAIVATGIPASQLSYALSQLPPSGTYTFAITVNGHDQNGAPAVSAPATATAVIP